MAHRGPVGVVPAARADQPVHLDGQHRLEHLQPGTDRQGEQALPGGASELGKGDGDLVGQGQLGRGRLAGSVGARG